MGMNRLIRFGRARRIARGVSWSGLWICKGIVLVALVPCALVVAGLVWSLHAIEDHMRAL